MSYLRANWAVFDLVILQDFNYGPFSTPQHLFRIRDYVKEGGALLMIGGRLGFGAGGYAGTELEEILPVQMLRPGFDDDALDTTNFKIALTPAGTTHTITRLSLNPAENKKLWTTLPRLEGVNKFDGLGPRWNCPGSPSGAQRQERKGHARDRHQ